jgi:hypothetical protein
MEIKSLKLSAECPILDCILIHISLFLNFEICLDSF